MARSLVQRPAGQEITILFPVALLSVLVVRSLFFSLIADKKRKGTAVVHAARLCQEAGR